MEFSAKDIAAVLNGTVEGNPAAKINTISKIEEGKEGSLSFLANPKYAKYIYTTGSSVVIVNNDFKPENKINCTLIRVNNAYSAFGSLLELYQQSIPQKTGIDKLSSISKTASVGKNLYLGDFAFIGENVNIGNNVKIYPHVYVGDNTAIGDNTIIYSGVKLYDNCQIGSDCVIHSGVVIGSDGFGFAPQSDKNYRKVPQVGNVIIEDKVEIGSNCSIDRATMGSTIIRKGVKLDNLIQVGHNVEIGENTVIAAQTGISGSTKIGKDCMIGGQVGIIGHIKIADGVKIAAQSGIGGDILNKNKIVQGSPAFERRKYQRAYVCYKNLPELREQVNMLERKVKDLNK